MGAPGRAHMERPRYRAATGMKKCVAFPGGALTDFGFQKRGVGWVRAPACACASARSRAVAQRQEEAAIVFLHLSSFAMRWTVPVPIPSDYHPQDTCSAQIQQRTEAAIGPVQEILVALHGDFDRLSLGSE